MSAFGALVKNDIRLGAKFTSGKFKWFYLYFIAGVLIGLADYTVFLIHAEKFDFDVTYVFPVFIPVFLFTSGVILSKEKRKDTIGWWLSLPYPRKILLGAKITASFVRFFKTMAIVIVTILVLFTEAYVIRPDLFAGNAVESFFIQLLRLICLLVAYSPFAVTFGMLLRLVGMSKWKPAAPLFWISIPTLFSSFLSWFFTDNGGPIVNRLSNLFDNPVRNFSIIIVLELAICAVVYWFSLYLLERQVEI